MIDREPPNAAETRGASVRTRFCETSGLVRALGALPIALERRIVGFQKPATGESQLNLWWIPAAGIKGAAYATVASYAYALVASALLGRHALRLPSPDADIAKIGLATVGMALAVWLMSGRYGMIELIAQIAFGGVVYAALLWLMNVAGLRSRFPSRSKE